MNTTYNRGFTLMELLVVIAIIGVLTAVVLASLNGARLKSSDSFIKAQLGQIRNSAEAYYSTNGTYGSPVSEMNLNKGSNLDSSMCSSFVSFWTCDNNARIGTNTLFATSNKGWFMIGPGGSTYALTAQLSGGNYWCIDSLGNTRTETVGSYDMNYPVSCP